MNRSTGHTDMETTPTATRSNDAAPDTGASQRVRVEGKFFFTGKEKLFLKGVTYGPFPVGADGTQFPAPDRAAEDFALMRKAGVNTVRVFTVPPLWLLDLAQEHGLRVMAGIPWAQHVAFLDNEQIKGDIRNAVMNGVRGLARHPAILAYMVGNEIPPDMIRWHGEAAVRRFLKGMVDEIKAFHPGALVSYANFPSTEYLTVDFTDFLCFNVYLHDEAAFRRYVARLHNLAVDRPLVLTEFGMDSMREGEAHQAETLHWQVKTAFELGVAGTCVFAWTDEWFTGGHLIEDWDFGLVDRARKPKPAFAAVAARYTGAIPPLPARTPRVSVVICAYNAERTMDQCLASLEHMHYPDYEVIVVNDGSTDGTLAISERYPYCRIISQPNKGLSVARNVGAEAATGEIVAYTDSDCVADPDWLTYLVAKMETKGLAICGGPNFPPPEDDLIPAAVAVSPGGPTHVLLDDEVAEHIAGCNMAFRRDILLGLGGFDPVYRAAGDDVDICWRFQDAGYEIGFAPAATVWHFRRNTVDAYLNQQKGYGKAEALVYSKHPDRFNQFGQAKWAGRIYGDLSSSLLLGRKPVIYSGLYGRGLFQSLYEGPVGIWSYLPLTYEWNVVALTLVPFAVLAGGWWLLLLLPVLVTLFICINGAVKAPIDKRFTGLKARALIAVLIYLSPLLRGWTRLKWRYKEAEAAEPIPATPGTPSVSLFQRFVAQAYWGQASEEKEVLITGLQAFLKGRRYLVQTANGWTNADMTVEGGIWALADILVCGEHHGGEKRVLRSKITLRGSVLTRNVKRLYGFLLLISLIAGAERLVVIELIVMAAHLVYIAQKTRRFATNLAAAIDSVAQDAKLTPLNRERH